MTKLLLTPDKPEARSAPTGFSRRQALMAPLGLSLQWAAASSLVSVPAWAHGAVPRPARVGRARSCILLYMEGGPSQLDTFDPKPGQPTGGPFKAIDTDVAGVRISEHLPRLARQMKRLCLIRSLTSKEGNHDRARHLMQTGYPPQGGVDHPALGSLVSELHGVRAIPDYVSIGGPGEDAGFLGAAYSPLPILNPKNPTRNLNPARGVDADTLHARLTMWRALEADFIASHPGSALVEGQRAVGEQAVALMNAPGVGAFDLAREPEEIRATYGDSPFGLGCLMARRLVAEGVGFVEVMLKGWDTHERNFERVRDLSATLDRAMAALLDDLARRGLLESTLVIWLGDFGRTPRINERGGRDHFPAASSVVLAGGGIRGGQVVGATSVDGTAIADRPVTVPDLFRTLALALGLDPDRSRFSPSGRPIHTVDGGTVIAGVL